MDKRILKIKELVNKIFILTGNKKDDERALVYAEAINDLQIKISPKKLKTEVIENHKEFGYPSLKLFINSFNNQNGNLNLILKARNILQNDFDNFITFLQRKEKTSLVELLEQEREKIYYNVFILVEVDKYNIDRKPLSSSKTISNLNVFKKDVKLVAENIMVQI